MIPTAAKSHSQTSAIRVCATIQAAYAARPHAPLLFVRLWCDQLTANHGLHTCDAATAPHELELCMLASDNDATIYTDLVRQARR